MVRAVTVVMFAVAGLVLAACGDPPAPLDPVAQLEPTCTDGCLVGTTYEGHVYVQNLDALELYLYVGNDPPEDGYLVFAGDPGDPFDFTQGLVYQYAPIAEYLLFNFRCLSPGSAHMTAVGAENADRSFAIFEAGADVACVDPRTADVEVRGPNGAVLPSLSEDAAGVKPHGVEFTREYTIKNIGKHQLTLMDTTFGPGMNCTGVVLVQATPRVLAPGASASMTVGVTPTAPGPFECIWDLSNSDPDENPYEITVTGTAPSGDIAITAPSSTGAITDGGVQAVGSKLAGAAFTETYRIDNDGLGFLTVGAATIGTLVNCSVSITTQPIITPLPPQTVGATSLVLSITPLAAGAFMCNVSVPSTDPDAENPYTWTISGTATAPEIDVDGFPDGGTDPVGNAGVNQAFMRSYGISNLGTSALTIAGVTPLTGTNCIATVFAAPAATVAAMGATAFTMTVTPQGPGAFSCPFQIMNNDSDEAVYDLTITGTAVAPEISIAGEAGAIADGGFDHAGNRPTGVPFTRMFTITNFGTAPLIITGPIVATTQTACSLTVTQPATTSIAPGNMTTFTVTVTPSSTADFFCSFTVPNNDTSESSYDLTVDGRGQAFAILRVSRGGTAIASGATDNVGSIQAGLATPFTYLLEDVGTAFLTVNSITVGSTSNCSVMVTSSTTPFTINPSGSENLTVGITPTAAGPFSFVVTIASSDPNNPSYSFTVMGVATPRPEIDILGFNSMATDAVGTVGVAPFSRTFTVRNLGSDDLHLGTVTFTTSNCSATVGTPAPSATVAPGGSTMLVIDVTPSAGAFDCTLNLPSDDSSPFENPYIIHITGTASAGIGNFSSKLGSHFGDNACGVAGYTLRNASGLRADGFGSTPDDFPFFVGADPNVATGTNMTILGVTGYTCTLSIVGPFTINIDCTKPAAPSCHEVSS